MSARTRSRLRLAFVGGGAAALIAVSVAGATDDSALIVGQPNGATRQTTLQGSIESPVFLITNDSTAAEAYGLTVNGNSAIAPAIPPALASAAFPSTGSACTAPTPPPRARLPGLLAETYSTSLNAVGIRGRIASNAPGEDSVAVHGENFGARSAGIGVWGEHRGSGIGVYGSSESGTGVLGRINFTSTSFGSVAVRGENNATGLNDVGVWGSQAGSGRGVVGTSPNGVGVYGRSQSGYGVIGDSFSGYGVVGNSGSNVGVKGSSGSRNGVQGFSSTGNGVYANSARGYALRANRGVSADAILPNHVALINNTSTGNSADVLALKIDYTGTPTGGNNFITFFKGGDAPVGAIQGNGSGGIELHSGSADYAEWLPKLQPAERLRPGEIVGVHGGRVTKQTAGADRPMVVSSGPIVLGNDPGAGKRDRYVQIALFGQVIVRVWGPITARDLIVPSGRMDGTGVAVRPEAASLVQLASFVGEAWSGAAGSGLHRVRVAVG